MAEKKQELKFKIPGKDAPGFLLRTKQALEFKRQMDSGTITPELVDAMVDYLCQYVSEPANKKEAVECLMMATEAQFYEMVGQIAGPGDVNPTPPEPNATS